MYTYTSVEISTHRYIHADAIGSMLTLLVTFCFNQQHVDTASNILKHLHALDEIRDAICATRWIQRFDVPRC